MSAESERLRHANSRRFGAAFHREDLSVISIKGADAFNFVERLSTAGLTSVEIPGAIQTLFLKGDGRLIADCVCCILEKEHLRLIVDNAAIDALSQYLDAMHFNEKLSIDPEPGTQVIQLRGPSESNLISRLSMPFFKVPLSPLATCDVFILVAQQDFESTIPSLWESVASEGAVVGNVDLFRLLRIEDGIPAWGAELSEKSIPLEVGLKSAISFTKGCFPGQEVVARIENLGHPANVLVGIRFSASGESLTGAELQVAGERAGIVTSSAFSFEAGNPLALAIVKWKFHEQGTACSVSTGGGMPIEGVVYELPMAGRV